MTSEQQDEQRAAESTVRTIGGALAVILGLQRSGQRVEWDPQERRFAVGDEFVSMDTVRSELRRLENTSTARMLRSADRLERGEITVEEWQRQQNRHISSLHIVAGALALGSIGTAVMSRTVRSAIDKERGYVRGFRGALKDLSPKAVRARAKSYARAANITYGRLEHAAAIVNGRTEARRTRTAEESCGDCIEYADIWMPIDDMPALGSLRCGNHCRCYLEYR